MWEVCNIVDFKQRGFDRKHLIVMSLGNIIGSGIFLASGSVINISGPAAIVAYAFGGFIMLLEVMFITEMSIVNPAPGSFRVHITEVFGPGMGFVNGWMFWCSGMLGMAGEVTAAAIYGLFVSSYVLVGTMPYLCCCYGCFKPAGYQRPG
jgi:GABA permease/S-methylmethionine transporter